MKRLLILLYFSTLFYYSSQATEESLLREAASPHHLDNRIRKEESQEIINGDKKSITTTSFSEVIISSQVLGKPNQEQSQEENKQDISFIFSPLHRPEAEEDTPRTEKLKHFYLAELTSGEVTDRLKKILEAKKNRLEITPTENLIGVHIKALDVLINKQKGIDPDVAEKVLSFMVNPKVLSKNRVANKTEQHVMVTAIEKSMEALVKNNKNLKTVEELLFRNFDTLNKEQKTHAQISYIIAAKAFGTHKAQEDSIIFKNIKENLNQYFGKNKFSENNIRTIYKDLTQQETI